MNFETSVKIERPVDEVFDYVSDPRNFPDWNSAVQAVRQTSPRTDGAATYSMVRELPDGRAENDLEVLASRRPTEFDIRTTSDSGHPIVVAQPDSVHAQIYKNIAGRVWKQLTANQRGPRAAPRIVVR